MKKEFKELKDVVSLLIKTSEKDLEDISETIEDFIKYKIQDERIAVREYELV